MPASCHGRDDDAAVPVRRQQRHARVLLLAKLAIAGILLWWLVANGELDFELLWRGVHPGYLALATASLFLSLAAPVWRWRWLLEIQGIDVTLRRALHIYWFGYFAAIFLPGAAGGDLARAYAVCVEQPCAKTRAVSTLLVDRVIGLHSLMVIAVIAAAVVSAGEINAVQTTLLWSIFGATAGVTIVLVLVFYASIERVLLLVVPGRWRTAVAESWSGYRRAWARLIWLWTFSVLCNLLSIGAFVFVAAALGVAPSWSQLLAAPIVIVANSVPITPGGLGVGEAVGAELFALFKLANGALVVLVVRTLIVTLSLPGVFLFPARRPWATNAQADQ